MNIRDYGYKGSTEYADKLVARVTATHRDRYELVCDRGYFNY